MSQPEGVLIAQRFRKDRAVCNEETENSITKIKLEIMVDFAETVKNIGEGITDICYMTPLMYIEAKEKYDVKVIAKALSYTIPEEREILKVIAADYTGFAESLDSDYDEIRRIMLDPGLL